MKNRTLFANLVGGILMSPFALEAASPDLNVITPRGGEVGTEIQTQFIGDRLHDTAEIVSYSPQIKPLEFKVVDKKKVDVKLAIAKDCPIGEHLFRLRTKSGLSTIRSFWVGQFPNVAETEPNGDFNAPQKVKLNTTVEGVIKVEDVDYFSVEAKKGQRIAVEVEGMRLGRVFDGRLLDPYVAILDKNRFELAFADDTALLQQDAFATAVAPEDGTYIIEIRDSAYEGNDRSRYRLHIGDFPRPSAVYPGGAKVGTEREFTLIGDPSGTKKMKFKVEGKPGERVPVFAKKDGRSAPSPNYVRASTFGDVLEAEPNNDQKQATPSQALPFAFNGIIEKPGDVDWFRFSAKKGQRFTFRAIAKAIQSPLDAVLNVYDADGKHIGGNDDSGGLDSKYDFKPQKDGDYFVRVRDHLDNGGPDYVYRIEAEPPVAGLSLSTPQFSRRDYQSRQMIYVARGNRSGIVVNLARRSFSADVNLATGTLPKGVTLNSKGIPKALTSAPLLFDAAKDAPLGVSLVSLNGIHAENSDVRGEWTQKLDFVIANPNNTVFYRSFTDKLAVAVVEEVPFHIEFETPKVPIVRKGTFPLKVKAVRKEGFKAPIDIRLLTRTPGVSATTTVRIPEGKNEVTYPISANGSAATGTFHFVVMGEANTPNGQAIASSDYIPLTVAEPYLDMKIEMASVTQGQSTNLVCKIEHKTPFEGKAKVRLTGLPAKCEAPELTFTKDTKELVFPVKTAPDSPKGQHKGLFCSVEIPDNGGIVLHALAQGGILRIDPPKPPKPTPKPEPKKEVAQANPK
ncbi:MAG: PPC domain-containing protein [Verrucomicrobiota bacterium]